MSRARVLASVYAALAVVACSAGGHTVQSPVAKASADAFSACTDLQTKVSANPSKLADSVKGPADESVMDEVTLATDEAQQAAGLDATWMPLYASLKDLYLYLTLHADGGPTALSLTPDLRAISATCEQLGEPLPAAGAPLA